MSYQLSHRQLSVLTHLKLPVEAHCRSSFFVDSVLCRIHCLCVSSRCTAGLLLTLTLCTLSASGGACCPSWALFDSLFSGTAAHEISNLVLHRSECR